MRQLAKHRKAVVGSLLALWFVLPALRITVFQEGGAAGIALSAAFLLTTLVLLWLAVRAVVGGDQGLTRHERATMGLLVAAAVSFVATALTNEGSALNMIAALTLASSTVTLAGMLGFGLWRWAIGLIGSDTSS